MIASLPLLEFHSQDDMVAGVDDRKEQALEKDRIFEAADLMGCDEAALDRLDECLKPIPRRMFREYRTRHLEPARQRRGDHNHFHADQPYLWSPIIILVSQQLRQDWSNAATLRCNI